MGQNESDELLTIFEKKKWPSLLGSNDFISWVKEIYFKKKIHRQIPESIQLAPAISMIIEEVCQAYMVKDKDLLIGQRGKSNEPRNVAIYLGRVLRNDTMMELGKTFGMSGYHPASSAVEPVKNNSQVNRKLQKKIEEIKQTLLAKQRPKWVTPYADYDFSKAIHNDLLRNTLILIVRLKIRVVFFYTLWTNTMTKFCFRVISYVALDLVPIPFIVTYFFAMTTNW